MNNPDALHVVDANSGRYSILIPIQENSASTSSDNDSYNHNDVDLSFCCLNTCMGMEYSFIDILFLRGGLYSNHNSASFMGGVGLNLGEVTPIANDFRFDMAVSNYGLLGFVKQFTVVIGL